MYRALQASHETNLVALRVLRHTAIMCGLTALAAAAAANSFWHLAHP